MHKVWATGYHVIAIPLAVGVLYNAGFIMGAAFMS
jgi:cation transport ATPase